MPALRVQIPQVVGSAEDMESTWRIDFVENGQGQFDDSVFNRYLISLQWSLATITPNNTELLAQNRRERMVWIGAAGFSLLFLATFVSRVTRVELMTPRGLVC